ncbi:MAG: hypothetical protein PHV21_03395 [Synergistaceae bacterium]|nr:hypothetical protein [Synergistaceae bacterium]
MSHFNVAVFSRNPSEIDNLLAPFNECVDADSPFSEFVEDEEGELNEAVGKNGYWTNPNARFDWYELGGRWRGYLKLKPGCAGEYGSPNPFDKNPGLDPTHCDQALVNDCDFKLNEAARQHALRFWEVAVEKLPLRENEKPSDFESFYNERYYLERYGTKEAYADWAASFQTYAFLTADGEFISTGRMGWFGFDDARAEAVEAYRKRFAAYLAEAQDQGLFISVYDFHI